MLFDISEVENCIKYSFKNKELLRTAFTHSSYSNEKRVQSNQRLEFLGDSVLNYVIADYIYRKFPDIDEGELTRIRASLVSAQPIAEAAERLGLKEFLLLGEGEKKSGNISFNIMADLFESVVGAICLDCDILKAGVFIKYALKKQLDNLSNISLDSKSKLSEICHKRFKTTVKYNIISQNGQAHMPSFTVAAVVNGVAYKSATADSKKSAEQLAALNALNCLPDSGGVDKDGCGKNAENTGNKLNENKSDLKKKGFNGNNAKNKGFNKNKNNKNNNNNKNNENKNRNDINDNKKLNTD